MRFTTHDIIPVTRPYRLDLTVDALRRLAANVVDVVGPDGAYYRALSNGRTPAALRVTQRRDGSLELQTSARDSHTVIPVVKKMLGTEYDLRTWQRRASEIPWLGHLARELRGVHPPRYASLFEACSHAIVFQQISIHAAAAIMRRVVEALGESVKIDGIELIAFPTPSAVLRAKESTLREAGLSTNKMMHLRSVAGAIESGEITEADIEALPTPAASERLVAIRGIGPWSAAVVLLRGFGRLDTFPLRDSGVARSIKLLSGDPDIDVDAVLDRLGPVRGMLYYHLLLGRIRNLVPPMPD
ncbi:MAG: DNA-3-methyladenine glycosylase 2 family protein [Candidatus Eremiobacteraeota bacterium]|nr:DNA-3-methyladenine glycosylase 2 family protein [Candidatus Eremiobacteraeota bacterium]